MAKASGRIDVSDKETTVRLAKAEGSIKLAANRLPVVCLKQ